MDKTTIEQSLQEGIASVRFGRSAAEHADEKRLTNGVLPASMLETAVPQLNSRNRRAGKSKSLRRLREKRFHAMPCHAASREVETLGGSP